MDGNLLVCSTWVPAILIPCCQVGALLLCWQANLKELFLTVRLLHKKAWRWQQLPSLLHNIPTWVKKKHQHLGNHLLAPSINFKTAQVGSSNSFFPFDTTFSSNQDLFVQDKTYPTSFIRHH